MILTGHIAFGLHIFCSEEKDWARHTARQCPLQNIAFGGS